MIDDPEIAWLRQQIDAIDHQILALLRQRADVVLHVGDMKRQKGLEIYDPDREQRLLDSLAQEVKAPLDDRAVRKVFRALVAECRRIEQAHVNGAA